MRRVNLYDFVELGKGIQSVLSLQDESRPVDGYIAATKLKKSLDLLKEEQIIDYNIVSHNVRDLDDKLKAISDRFQHKNEEGKEYTEIGWSARYYATSSANVFENVLAAQCRAAATYSVSKVGIYSTNDLIENAASRFADDTQNIIGKDALGQLQEAAQCLSFQLHTACGFHMMRAVEYVLLIYMKKMCGRKFSSLNTNWGSYIDELEKIAKGKARKKPAVVTIDLLRQLKNNHRNPVMHAEFVLNPTEAQDIFELGSVVISHLAQKIDV
jgi:hypothetical protein